MSQKNNQHLLEAMAHLRDYRIWALKRGIDPWISRQALIMTLELDTIAALNQGVNAEDLATFDSGCRKETKDLAEKEGWLL